MVHYNPQALFCRTAAWLVISQFIFVAFYSVISAGLLHLYLNFIQSISDHMVLLNTDCQITWSALFTHTSKTQGRAAGLWDMYVPWEPSPIPHKNWSKIYIQLGNLDNICRLSTYIAVAQMKGHTNFQCKRISALW